jgi:hypothetical protein
LRSIRITHPGFDDEALVAISRCRSLRYLDLTDSSVTEKGLRAISALENLEYLSLPCEKLTDADVKVLTGHPRLERIYLHSTKPVLGRASLQALNRMQKLRELAIVCTDDITDADVMGFADIPTLELLSIATKAPLTCRERLQARLPDCKIYFLDEPPE